MRRISHRRPVCHELFDLPLFRWSAVHCMPPLTTGGQHVHRRHHVPRELANLVAELAGLGRKRDR
jgi:hypothetical protein